MVSGTPKRRIGLPIRDDEEKKIARSTPSHRFDKPLAPLPESKPFELTGSKALPRSRRTA